MALTVGFFHLLYGIRASKKTTPEVEGGGTCAAEGEPLTASFLPVTGPGRSD